MALDRASRCRAASKRLVVLVLAVSLLGCAPGTGDDPGVTPGDGQPNTTSNTLGRCPAGGPDATTPPAGCLGPDGSVLRP